MLVLIASRIDTLTLTFEPAPGNLLQLLSVDSARSLTGCLASFHRIRLEIIGQPAQIAITNERILAQMAACGWCGAMWLSTQDWVPSSIGHPQRKGQREREEVIKLASVELVSVSVSVSVCVLYM